MSWGIAFDSTTPDVLPVNTPIVGGYVNGRFTWSKSDWERFPGSKQLRINVTGIPGRGNTLDVERGDATPDHCVTWWESVTWVKPEHRCIYVNRDQFPAVASAMGKRPFMLWLATLDGSMPTVYKGRTVDLVQFLPASKLGFNADMSAVYNKFLLTGVG
jgi:hypothetical protein